VGEPLAAVVDQRIGIEADAVAQDDQRLGDLAPTVVRHCDHRGVRHVGMLEQAGFDLQRGDVLAAGDDHVLLAVGDP
jgi:hypothetical protein